MPRNGYWIECVPLSDKPSVPDLPIEQYVEQYRAVFSSIPDLDVVAQTPDQAIDRLRHKLQALGRYYRMKGRDLPESDNPVRPPRNLRSVQGWISVYVQFSENCQNC
ncbi:MAG TPA: hypothetical protein PKI93_01325 [Alphaproteobacteria bacterium]|nr:hypothetical protein [Alphaproteobacteria bacterium]HNS44438.1 hypothetical protein [Alphaproteobacteria bacterium]